MWFFNKILLACMLGLSPFRFLKVRSKGPFDSPAYSSFQPCNQGNHTILGCYCLPPLDHPKQKFQSRHLRKMVISFIRIEEGKEWIQQQIDGVSSWPRWGLLLDQNLPACMRPHLQSGLTWSMIETFFTRHSSSLIVTTLFFIPHISIMFCHIATQLVHIAMFQSTKMP